MDHVSHVATLCVRKLPVGYESIPFPTIHTQVVTFQSAAIVCFLAWMREELWSHSMTASALGDAHRGRASCRIWVSRAVSWWAVWHRTLEAATPAECTNTGLLFLCLPSRLSWGILPFHLLYLNYCCRTSSSWWRDPCPFRALLRSHTETSLCFVTEKDVQHVM